ncbi:hypothetical protein AB0J63_42550 [Streptosporangium canum]|uniref:hypothetical protein n=1 Tax=Streptosporangium canum TaxID=324952 RepID=UPI00342823A0
MRAIFRVDALQAPLLCLPWPKNVPCGSPGWTSRASGYDPSPSTQSGNEKAPIRQL